jgi:ribosome-associated protein
MDPTPGSSVPESIDAARIAEEIASRGTWTASRSSGPGGQRRDKVSTRAELTLTAEALEGLDDVVRARLAGGLGLEMAPLRLVVQDERALSRNQALVLERLTELVRQALAPPPPPRRPTRPSRTAKARRLEEKAQRGGVKVLRRPPRPED